MIESRGPLPLRVRLEAGGLHHRPAFPGSPVVVADRCFEVVAERVEAGRVLYDLDPWAEPHVLRAPVSYGEDLVRGQLPHLTWTPSHRLQAGSDYWTIESLVPGYAGGPLLYAYRLRPVSPTAASAPGPEAYHQELRERIDREWTDLLRSGLEPLVSLLPASVQRRALGRRCCDRSAPPTTSTATPSTAS